MGIRREKTSQFDSPAFSRSPLPNGFLLHFPCQVFIEPHDEAVEISHDSIQIGRGIFGHLSVPLHVSGF